MAAQAVFLTGDWIKVNKIFDGMALRLIGARNRVGHELAAQGARNIKANIYSQRYPHVPLAPMTVAEKAKQGLDPRILIATGEMVGAIEEISLGAGRWGIGISDPEIAKKLEENEFGSVSSLGKVVPARPVLQPEMERLRAKARMSVKMAFALALEGNRYASEYAARATDGGGDASFDVTEFAD